jgi:hypothetical protein
MSGVPRGTLVAAFIAALASAASAAGAGCGGGAAPKASRWGQPGPGGWGQLGAVAATEVRSPTWDVLVKVRPEQVTVSEETGMWRAQAESAEGGSFSLLVIRDPSVQSAFAFATVLRDDAREKGADAGDVGPQSFMGKDGARYYSVFPDSGAAALTVVAVSGKCVYVLLAMRGGTSEEIVDYFNWSLAVVGTASGGPADAPACR